MVSPKLPARSTSIGLALMLWGILLLGAVPGSLAADAVSLTTPYPGVAAAPGAKVSFDISVTTATPGRVDLAVRGAPTAWNASLRGGGFVVDSVTTQGTEAAKVTLDVEVPADAIGGTQRIQVVGTKSGATTTLPLDIRVTPEAAGSVSMTTDFPQLKGASDQTFTFNLTLTNSTPDDLTFGVVATGPAGWTVDAQNTSQAQAASTIVKAGENASIKVTAKPSEGATAGSYPIAVDATSGSQTAHSDLAVEITGSYKLALSTPDGRLNATASAGSPTDLSLVVSNSGTADIDAVAMAGTPPRGWTVTFTPTSVPVTAGGTAQVTAHLTPSGDAIAGDYVASFTATADVASASTDIRVTVETSLQWGIVGIGLIVLVLVGLWWTFRRYGRR